ncbi:MAG: nucleotide-binding universal stress UspA family protein [Oceanicoccus sp.]|jgi:nucleotide-binding universal stress UspA family protein
MNILITTDGRLHSEEAIRFTSELFKELKPKVTVMHVRPENHPEETEEMGRKYLKTAAKILKPFGIKATLKYEEGDTSECILHAVDTGNFHLLVMGSQGHSSVLKGITGSLLHQSTEDVVSVSPLSILLVKNPPKKVRKVLLCTDGSTYAESAIDFWGRLKKSYEPQVTLLNIVPNVLGGRFQSYVDTSVRKQLLHAFLTSDNPSAKLLKRGKIILEQYGIGDVDIKLREKKYAASEIIKESEEGDYDLIVMGYQGVTEESSNKTPGTQSYEVLKHSQTSVLVHLPQKMKGV